MAGGNREKERRPAGSVFCTSLRVNWRHDFEPAPSGRAFYPNDCRPRHPGNAYNRACEDATQEGGWRVGSLLFPRITRTGPGASRDRSCSTGFAAGGQVEQLKLKGREISKQSPEPGLRGCSSSVGVPRCSGRWVNQPPGVAGLGLGIIGGKSAPQAHLFLGIRSVAEKELEGRPIVP